MPRLSAAALCRHARGGRKAKKPPKIFCSKFRPRANSRYPLPVFCFFFLGMFLRFGFFFPGGARSGGSLPPRARGWLSAACSGPLRLVIYGVSAPPSGGRKLFFPSGRLSAAARARAAEGRQKAFFQFWRVALCRRARAWVALCRRARSGGWRQATVGRSEKTADR